MHQHELNKSARAKLKLYEVDASDEEAVLELVNQGFLTVLEADAILPERSEEDATA